MRVGIERNNERNVRRNIGSDEEGATEVEG